MHIFSSHANDLALQIAKEVTGHSEVVVLDGAYHGHTKPLMGLSTYKSRQQKEGESGIGSNPHAWIVSGYEHEMLAYLPGNKNHAKKWCY